MSMLTLVIIASSLGASTDVPSFDYLAPYNTSGVPANLLPDKEIFSQQFLKDLSNSLPEARSIVLHHPEYIAGDAGANIHLTEDAEVFVTFLHEGAGYRNALGYFTFDPTALPRYPSEVAGHIVFPNASFPNSGGDLTSGSTVKLGVFPANTNIGFFVVSDGWNGYKVLNHYWTVYSLAHLNPEPDTALRRHVALLWDVASQRAVLGFEDMRRDKGSDDDFNDVMFTIRTTPVTALDTTTLKPVDPVQDADGDGANDNIDQFPSDPLRAFETVYPSANGWGCIAFEDNWPSKGDFDLNDLVLRFRARQITNAAGLVRDVVMNFEVVARGAAMHDGFAVRFPGVAATNVSDMTIAINDNLPVPLPPEAGQPDAVAVLFSDAHDQIGTPGKFANTYTGSASDTGTRFVLRLTVNTPVAASALGSAPYDSFMIINGQRGREVHQVAFPPTRLADERLIGTQDDTSNLKKGRYYRTAGNLPWVLVVPVELQWPTEKTDIGLAYPRLLDWAVSGGTQYGNWYGTDVQQDRVWKPAQ